MGDQPVHVATDDAQVRPRWRFVGPGLVVAATGVGAADLVATLVAGARYGYALLWVAVLGAILKVILVEAAGRYSLATERSIFEGWRSLGRWTTWYFAPYIVIWGFVYGATAMSSSALPIITLFPGLELRWVAMISGLIGLAMVWFGSYLAFEKVIAVLVGVMFVTVVGAAIVAVPNVGQILLGLRPILPEGSVLYALALAGGVGGTITLADMSEAAFDKAYDDLLRAGDVARTGPQVLCEDDDLEAALSQLAETGEDRVAIVDDTDTMIFKGYVTHAGVMAAYNKALLKTRHDEHGE